MSKKSAFLVILQLTTMLYLLMFNFPFSVGFGFIIQILGIVIGLWGILVMKVGDFNIQPEVKSITLITKGPYKWIRNPMYTAVILFYFPIVIDNPNWINGTVFMVLLLTLLLKIQSEEQFLVERFGEEYSDYKKQTKRIIPFIY